MKVTINKNKLDVVPLKNTYRITVNAMYGDGDVYPTFTDFKSELTDEDILIIDAFTDNATIGTCKWAALEDTDEQKFNELCELQDTLEQKVYDNEDDFWSPLLNNWDPISESQATVRSIEIQYYDEQSNIYECELKIDL